MSIVLTMAAKFIQSSHQNGMPAMTRARNRMDTTITIRQRRTTVGTIHDLSYAGSLPHRVLVAFKAAIPTRNIRVNR